MIDMYILKYKISNKTYLKTAFFLFYIGNFLHLQMHLAIIGRSPNLVIV